jgi:branched-chain amino acid transport system substrate-binding protein
MRLSLPAAALIVIITSSCTPASPQSHDQGPLIAIASDLPTTGPFNADVVPLRAAIELAINGRGSIDGYPLVYEPFDDSLIGVWSGFKGEQNVRIMTKEPQVLAVIGPYNSQVAGLEIPVTNEAGLVLMSPSNTADCLTSVAAPCVQRSSSVNNYFRIGASDSAQASAAAHFAIARLNLKRFAVLTDDTGYGNMVADTFIRELTASGGTVAFHDTYPQNADDYSPVLREARQAGAEAVFVGGFDFTGTCKIRAAMPSIFPTDAYLLSGDRIIDPACVAAAKQGANDHFLAMVSDSRPAPNSKVFKEFQAHGIRPVTYAFSAYDCAQLIIDAISRAMQANGGKIPTRREVLDAVAATRDFVGVSGTFTFQPSGDAVNPAVSVDRVQNGDWSFWQNAT